MLLIHKSNNFDDPVNFNILVSGIAILLKL